MDQRTEIDDAETAGQRSRMVAEQLERRGVRAAVVLEAMRRVPRHLFVGPGQRSAAYDDRALPIGEGQTISQPYMVAVMTAALQLRPGARVLEIGTGSGYQAAVLAEIAGDVITVERRPAIAEAARARLAALGYRNIRVFVSDGSLGYAARAPYDGILVTAGAPRVPPSLQAQLTDGARLVVPVGSALQQDLVVVTRQNAAFNRTTLDACVFVPLVGGEGWPDPDL
jgi:protein-L-isoaspartate(D-aspartate) O-methyltransferase